MRSLYWVSIVLAIVGCLNWGLFGLANTNLVSKLFGIDTIASTIIYSLVGLSGVYLLIHSVNNSMKKS